MACIHELNGVGNGGIQLESLKVKLEANVHLCLRDSNIVIIKDKR